MPDHFIELYSAIKDLENLYRRYSDDPGFMSMAYAYIREAMNEVEGICEALEDKEEAV